jgi:hypothetical protein
MSLFCLPTHNHVRLSQVRFLKTGPGGGLWVYRWYTVAAAQASKRR